MKNKRKLKKALIMSKPNTKFGEKMFCSVWPQNNEEKIVYGKIIEGEEGEIEQISILSKDMIEMDNDFFARNSTQDVDEYHPYFCEFIIDHKIKMDKEIVKMLKKNVGKWLKIYILTEDNTGLKHDSIHGTLIFSASPIIRKGCYLKFDCINFGEKLSEMSLYEKMKKQSLIKIINDYHEIDVSKIKNRFKEITEDLTSIEGYVYNVGQGNCISMNLKNTFGYNRIFFDIGESMLPNDENEEPFYIEQNETEIAKIKPSMVILSHWDMDHILGVHSLKDSVFDINNEDTRTYWIAPNLKMLANSMISVSAARLCAYLVKSKSILMFDNKGESSLVLESNDKKIKIYQGSGEESANGIRNNIGLILTIKFSSQDNSKKYIEQNLLFPGDCEYSKMHPEISENLFDFIVSSHHGSKHAVLNENGDEVWLVNSQGHAKAIISCGCNKYNHPDACHLNALKKYGFIECLTIGFQWIKFEISNVKSLSVINYPNQKERQRMDERYLAKQNQS